MEQKSKSRPKVLQSTVYHETGHAVFGYFLKLGLKRVTVVPTETGIGYAAFRPAPWSKQGDLHYPEDYHWAKRDIVCTLAGLETERLVTKRLNYRDAGADFAMVGDLAMRVWGSAQAIEGAIMAIRLSIRWIISQPEMRAIIDNVALALTEKEELRYAEVKAIIEAALTLEFRPKVRQQFREICR